MRQITRNTLLACAVAALPLVTACATIAQSIKTPAISLAEIKLADATLTSQTFLLNFTVDNPNAIPIPISSIGYAVNLAGQTLAKGATDKKFTVPANGQGTFKVRVKTDLVRSGRALSQLVLAGGQRELEYNLSGAVTVDLPLLRPLPFRQAGVVSLER